MLKKQFFGATLLFALLVFTCTFFLESSLPRRFQALENVGGHSVKFVRKDNSSAAGEGNREIDPESGLSMNRSGSGDNIIWFESAMDSHETFYLKSIAETLDEKSFYENASRAQIGRDKHIHINLAKYFYLKKITMTPAVKDRLSAKEEEEFMNPNKYPPWIQEYQTPSWLATSSNVCKDSAPFLLILVLSTPSSRQSRMTIRQTWGSVAVSQTWPHTPLNAKVKVLFVIGSQFVAPSLDNMMLMERFLFDDILLLDMTEGYNKLTLKMLASLQWVENHCSQVQFVLKADEDSFINIPLLTDYLLVHRRDLSKSVFGSMYSSPGVWRGGKWSVTYTEYPFTNFPSYASGSSYVLAGDAIPDLLRASKHFLPVPIEDAFITGILPKRAGITRYHCHAMSKLAEINWGSLPTMCQYYYTRFAVTDLTAEIFDRMWLTAQINYCNTNGYHGLDFIGDKSNLKRS